MECGAESLVVSEDFLGVANLLPKPIWQNAVPEPERIILGLCDHHIMLVLVDYQHLLAAYPDRN